MSGYPITLQLNGKTAVVVGGGVIASRKINGLLEAGADVTVVSPVVTDQIDLWIKTGKVRWIQDIFDEKYICDAFLVFAATNDKQVNQSVLEAVSEHQLVNVVDNPSCSDFHVPAVIRKGKLVVTVSTQGASPGFAKYMKKKVEDNIDEKYSLFLDFLAETRTYVQTQSLSEKKRHLLLKDLSSEDMLNKHPDSWKREADKLIAYYQTLENEE